jgi:hypothetical protein
VERCQQFDFFNIDEKILQLLFLAHRTRKKIPQTAFASDSIYYLRFFEFMKIAFLIGFSEKLFVAQNEMISCSGYNFF